MGGIGSGRWHAARAGCKPTVEETPGVGAKPAADAIGAESSRGRVWVGFRETGQRAMIEAVACRFGGGRWWWRCPGCGRRRAELYRHRGQWACRVCQGLAYRSSRESRRHQSLINRMMWPGWTLSLLRRLIFEIDLERINLGGPWVDRRGRRWGQKRRLKLLH